MGQVRSKDGTPIAYDRQGGGPAVIVVGGGLDDGSENAPLAMELAEQFTVYNYARRGRGDSGDMRPYAVLREIEETRSGHRRGRRIGVPVRRLDGWCSRPGGCGSGIAIDKLAVYEVPYNLADGWPRRWREYVQPLGAALAEGRHDDALELFMRLAGSFEEDIVAGRNSRVWPDLRALAHTLAYDAACPGDGQPPAARLAKITRPALVATGVGAQLPGAASWVRALDQAADTIAASIPHAERRSVEGQTHVVDPKTFAPVLTRFFGA